MKKAFRLFGIVALAALIGFSMIACDDGVGGPGGGGGGGGESGAGRLTVTGLPSGGRWSVYVYPQSVTVSGGYGSWPDSNEEAWDLNEPSEGNTFQLHKRGNDKSVRWTGSGSWTVAMHYWGSAYGDYTATVNFSNGSATVPFSSFRQVD